VTLYFAAARAAIGAASPVLLDLDAERRLPGAQGVLRFAVPVVFPQELARSLTGARVVVVIPSRFQSSRFPGKPLALIDGRPMIEHVFRRAAEARSVDATIVATDDERVAVAVDAFGGTAVMTDADHATGTDRLAEVAGPLDCEIIVNVQGDEPLVTPAAVDDAVEPLLRRPSDVMSTLRQRLDDPADLDNPSVVKIVVDEAGYALYFSRRAIPFVRPTESVPQLWRHMGLYAYRRRTLIDLSRLPQTPLERAEGLEQLRALEHGIRIATVETPIATIGVDTPEDLERVRRLFAAGAHP
jgi:3-deoxy-manno-octulosonate cytidylyltransferase (CMP-KDO synthetase)